MQVLVLAAATLAVSCISGSANSLRSCAQRCSDEIALVCASDGATYANDCFFRVAQCENKALMVVSQGMCGRELGSTELSVQTPRRCEKGCTREYMPVCGSDGITYPNKCVFRNAQRCKYRGKLWIVKDGAC